MCLFALENRKKKLAAMSGFYKPTRAMLLNI